MRRLTGWLGRLLLVVGSVAAGLVLCEITIRLVKPQPVGFDTGAIWEPVAGLRWRQRPNLDVRVYTGEREVRLLTDSARHRVGATPAAAGQIRILAVGDSMLEALQVEHEQTMSALLGRSLSATLGRQVEVVNAGVGGWDPNQYLIATKQELQESSYALVLIFVYLDNDIVSRRVASYPAATDLEKPALRPFRDGAARTLDVLGIRLQAALRQHSHLFVFSQNLLSFWSSRTAGRPHLLSNAMRSNAASPAWQITGDILEDIAVTGGRFHVPVLFILLPPAHYIDAHFLAVLERGMGLAPEEIDVRQPAERLGGELKRRGIEVFDAAPVLKQAFDAGERDLYGHIDVHFAPAGHQVMARFLHPIVLSHLAAEVGH